MLRKQIPILILLLIAAWVAGVPFFDSGPDGTDLQPSFLQLIGTAMLAGILSIFLSIFWRTRLRRLEHRFQKLLEHGTDIIQAFKKDGTIVYQSPSHNHVLGYGPGELMGKSVFDLFHEEDITNREKFIHSLLSGENVKIFVHRFRHKKGHFIYLESQCINLLDNKALKAIVMTGRDITEMRQIKELLQSRKEGHQKNEFADKAKNSRFLSEIFHEIRTRLNGISGYSQILGRDKELTNQQTDAVRIIRHSAEDLLMLISELADFSKTEAGEAESETKDFSLIGFLNNTAEIIQTRARQKGLFFDCHISPDLPATVHSDDIRLRRILFGLLGDMISSAEKGGLAFSVFPAPESPNGDNSKQRANSRRIRFEAKTAGHEIPAEHADNTGENQRSSSKLEISQRLIRMAGDLHITSIPKKETVFCFELEFPEIHREDKTEKEEDKYIIGFKGEKKKLLIVDDISVNRLLLKDALLPLGFEIAEAIHGAEALEKAVEMHPDIVLMDLVMPVMDGFEAARRIRNIPDLKKVIVMAVSASLSEYCEDDDPLYEFDDYISKPVDIDELLKRLQLRLKLEWIYAEEAECDASSEKSLLALPPKEDIEAVYNLARRGDIFHIMEYVKKFESPYSQFKAFGNKIYQLAKEFKINQLEEFLKKSMERET